MTALKKKRTPQIVLDTPSASDYFSGCKTPDDVRRRFRELAKVHHPDVGGSTETFVAVMAALEDAQALVCGFGDPYLDMFGMTEEIE